MWKTITLAALALFACDVEDDGANGNAALLEDTDIQDEVADAPGAPADGALDRQATPTPAEGFGCPNDLTCHNHCKSIPGYKGGYCKWQLICKCY